MQDVTCVLPIGAQLGEGVLWCEREAVVWWVDIRAPSVNRFDPASGENTVFAMPEPVGCLALGRDGRVLCALASGLAWLDPATGGLADFTRIEAEQPLTRLNDGRVDRQGRLWVGQRRSGARSHRRKADPQVERPHG